MKSMQSFWAETKVDAAKYRVAQRVARMGISGKFKVHVFSIQLIVVDVDALAKLAKRQNANKSTRGERKKKVNLVTAIMTDKNRQYKKNDREKEKKHNNRAKHNKHIENDLNAQ